MGFLLPDSEFSVGRGATKRTLATFTVLAPQPQVVTGIKLVKDKTKLKERTACEV